MLSPLERVAAGDPSAVDDCIREYGGLVYRLAAQYLNLAREEVEDAVQEVFIEIWISAKRFDPDKGSDTAFVATIAHRRIIDRQRSISARRRAMRRHRQLVVHPDRERSEDQIIVQDAQASLIEEFKGLPDAEREALRLSLSCGLTHEEIAQATGTPLGTVKSRLRRAMMRLGESLLKQNEGIG